MRLIDDEADIPFQINIVPMIDVIFAILTFFIMSTLFLTRSEGLPVNLPQAITGVSQAQSNPVTVTIDRQGQIALNRQPVNLDTLARQVGQLAAANPSSLVIINADREVSHGQVVAVMDRLRQIQGVRLAIATLKP